MAWREVGADGLPKLDLSHPRVQAAMKITGITKQDLEGKPASPRKSPLSARSVGGQPHDKLQDTAGSQTSRSELAARSKELRERKRVQLLRELEETADAMEDDEVEAVLSPKGDGDIEVSQKIEQEKKRLEEMRQRQIQQLQRDAKRKLAKSIAQEAAEKKREELDLVLQERSKARDELLAQTKEKRAVQHQKARDQVTHGMKELVGKRREILKMLSKQSEHVKTMLADRFSGESEKQQEIQRRMARIAEQTLAQEQADLEKSAQAVEDAQRKNREVQTRLQQQREEQARKLAERRSKFSGKMVEVMDFQAQQVEEKERGFLDRAAKLEAARALHEVKAQEAVDNSKAERDKLFARWMANRQKKSVEHRAEIKGLRAKIQEREQKSIACRTTYYDELIFSKSANRSIMEDLVESNKARIARAQDSAREQTLAKVERDRARAQASDEIKRMMDSKRVAIIKESMDSRAKVEELHGLDPSAGETNTRRINEILTHLGLEPWSPPKMAKEEEDGQQK